MMANITCIIRVIIVVAIIQIMQLWLPVLIMLLARLRDSAKQTEPAVVLFFKKTVPGLRRVIILFLKNNNGNSWIAYHAIWKKEAEVEKAKHENKYVRKVMCIEPVIYKNGWPVVEKKY